MIHLICEVLARRVKQEKKHFEAFLKKKKLLIPMQHNLKSLEPVGYNVLIQKLLKWSSLS